eukprot:6702339-Prymnesium_polylepis.1
MRAGGDQTDRTDCPRPPRSFHSPCVLSPDPVTTPGRPVLGACVRGGRQTALPRRVARGVRTPNQAAEDLSPPRGGHGQHDHAPRPVPPPHRTTSRSPRR